MFAVRDAAGGSWRPAGRSGDRAADGAAAGEGALLPGARCGGAAH